MADLIPFGEYRPDLNDLNTGYTSSILNVIPRADGYGPFPSLSAITSTLPAACRGAFFARKSDGSVAIFGATATNLYLLNNTTLAWSLVSKGGTSYTSVSSNALWQFEQFNNYVIAVQGNVIPQVYDLRSSTNFADLGGSPPQASYISIVNRFVLLSGLTSYPYRIQWSGLNDPTQWTSGVNSSDFQDFSDGGLVRGAVGGELGFVFQDQAIRRMVFAAGSDVIFDINRVAKDVGLLCPYAIVSAGDEIYFLSAKGFQKLSGGAITPIGREKVDRTFFATFDVSQPQLMIGAHAPESGRIFWGYSSITNGASATFDSVLVYDPFLDRWAPASISGQFILSLAKPGMTLEGLDAIAPGTSIDALTMSLDSFAGAATPQIGMFGPTNAFGFFNGASLEATLQTGEQSSVSQRMFVQGFYPATDATAAYGNIGKRENMNASAAYTAEQPMNARGFVPARADTRAARGRLRIPAGTAWTNARGIEPLVIRRGKR